MTAYGQVINGVLPRVRTGVQWRELPGRFGPWQWVQKYRGHSPYYWPEHIRATRGGPRGWMQRFPEGHAIPSEVGLGNLLPDEVPATMPNQPWRACCKEPDQLQNLAIEARRARQRAREVLRILERGK